MLQKIRGSVAVKLSLITFLVIVVTAAAVTVVSAMFVKSNMTTAFGKQAMGAAAGVAAAIDGDLLDEVIDGANPDDEYIVKLQPMFNDVKTRIDALYFYMLAYDADGALLNIIEGEKPGDKPGECSVPFEKVSTEAYAGDSLMTLQDGKSRYSDVYDSHEFGFLLTGMSAVKDSSGKTVAVVGADISVDEISKAVNSFVVVAALFAVALAVIIGALMSVYLIRTIGRPIAVIDGYARKIAEGDSTFEFAGLNRTDEIGELSEAFEKVIHSTREQTAALDRLADGDYTARLNPRSERDSINVAIVKMITNNTELIAGINTASNEVAEGAHRMSEDANNLANGAMEQSAVISRLGEALMSVSGKTHANAEQAERAAELSKYISDGANAGRERMGDMISAVEEISKSAQDIGKVIKIIDDIAFQTNILALNAAVEAARAGQHGKGFAVVAEEVRNLASKSAAAAHDTGALITASMEKADRGGKIAHDTSEALDRIVSGIRESSALIDNIARSSREQDGDISLVNADIDRISQVVQRNSAIAEESASVCTEINGQCDALTEMVGQFKINDVGTRRLHRHAA